MGWTQQRIADYIGVPRQTLTRWFAHNGLSSKVSKYTPFAHNAKAMNVSKPTFLSWCGRIEDFQPVGDICFDLIIADPPWNISTPIARGIGGLDGVLYRHSYMWHYRHYWS